MFGSVAVTSSMNNGSVASDKVMISCVPTKRAFIVATVLVPVVDGACLDFEPLTVDSRVVDDDVRRSRMGGTGSSVNRSAVG